MKQLLLATAALVGMSAAALAAEPVALSDSQLDGITAGVTVALGATTSVFPGVSFGVTAPPGGPTYVTPTITVATPATTLGF
jgi:spore coat protein U-like protein